MSGCSDSGRGSKRKRPAKVEEAAHITIFPHRTGSPVLPIRRITARQQKPASAKPAVQYEQMAEKLSILCFGDSLTAGYHRWGLDYHSYAIKLMDILAAEFPNAERSIYVNGVPGDLVIYPSGSFLSRLQGECAERQYDFVFFSRGNQVCTTFLPDQHCANAIFSFSDLGDGNPADMIYYALKDCWDIALATGANVLALTVPECGVKSESLDTRRNTLNSHILEHQAER